MSDDAERRGGERADRRKGDRRQQQISIFVERRIRDRRRVPRRLIDVFRRFLGLSPLE